MNQIARKVLKQAPSNVCVAWGILQDVCEFLQTGGMVAVYDATNTSMERRKLIHDVVCERMGYKLFFIESICNAPNIIETNIMVRMCTVYLKDFQHSSKMAPKQQCISCAYVNLSV